MTQCSAAVRGPSPWSKGTWPATKAPVRSAPHGLRRGGSCLVAALGLGLSLSSETGRLGSVRALCGNCQSDPGRLLSSSLPCASQLHQLLLRSVLLHFRLFLLKFLFPCKTVAAWETCQPGLRTDSLRRLREPCSEALPSRGRVCAATDPQREALPPPPGTRRAHGLLFLVLFFWEGQEPEPDRDPASPVHSPSAHGRCDGSG